MSNDKLTLDYSKIPVLAVGFSRGIGIFGAVTAWVTGGVKAIGDKKFPRHAFLIAPGGKQLFADEETKSGLMQDSLEQYTTANNCIVSMFYWKGFDDPTRRQWALDKLDYIRRQQGNRATREGKYVSIWKLAKFLPIIGKFVKVPIREDDAQWCSMNVAFIIHGAAMIPATIHPEYKASFADTITIDPETLFRGMQCSPECQEIYCFYLPNITPIDEVMQAMIAKPQDTKLNCEGLICGKSFILECL